MAEKRKKSQLPNLRKMETVRGGESNERNYSKNKRGLESVTQDCGEDINKRLHIVWVSFVLERMGGAHLE